MLIPGIDVRDRMRMYAISADWKAYGLCLLAAYFMHAAIAAHQVQV